MKKIELITAVAEAAEISKYKAKHAIEAVFSNIEQALQKEKSVQITGFGTFSVAHRKARTTRNPKTGDVVEVAACKAAKFKQSKHLKEGLNK